MRHVASLLAIGLTAFLTVSAAPVDLAAGRYEGETPVALTTAPSGALYVTGHVSGARRGGHIYVAKLEPGGGRREYTAYLRSSADDVVTGIAIDGLGNAYIAGYTNSSRNFTVFGGVASTTAAGMDAFVAKVDGKGNWLFSTLLGGSGNDAASALAVDAGGDVYVTGSTSSFDFPAEGQRGGETSTFLVKFHGGRRSYAKVFGDGGRTTAHGIALDADGAAYIAGSVEARGKTAGFLAKFNARGEQMYRSTLSGNEDHTALSVAVTAEGIAWVGGWASTGHTGRDALLARFDAEGRQTFSKRIGGKSEGHQVVLDLMGNLYLSGVTRSADSPAPWSFTTKLNADGDHVYLQETAGLTAGSSAVRMAVDRLGNVMLTSGGTVQTVATCSYRLNRSAQTFDASGGESSAVMDTSSECGWVPESTAAWMIAARVGDRVEFRAMPNDTGGPRGGTIAAGGQSLIVLQAGKGNGTRAAITGAIRANTGFQTSQITACDDCSAAAVTPLGFSINFFGTTYNDVWVNNNGNITFGGSNGTYTATPISSVNRVLIAPFWADVDTNGTGSGLTRYGQDLVNGRKAFGVNWIDVGYFSSQVNKLNSFQVVLIDRNDLGVGFFDIELNYASIQWETGNASGGSNGLGGSPARAGFSNGTGTGGTSFELPGSGIVGAFLNGGANALATNSSNSGGVAGRYVYNVRAGAIVCGTGINTTTAAPGVNGGTVTVNVTASNASCTWSVTGLPTWITINSPAGGNGSGNGTVSLQVAANGGAARTVLLTIAGQTFTVSQAGTAVPNTCAPYSFLRAADLSMMSGSTSQGTISGLARLLDGSMTLQSFTGNTTNFVQTATPNFQSAFSSCIGLPPHTPTTPANYRLLSEQRGTAAVNPVFTDLMNNGQSSGVGVGSYSLDSAKLQVWNEGPNKVPGAKVSYDAPANPQKILSGDLNNDTKRDVVLLSAGPSGGNGVVSIYPGIGDGTLGARRDTTVGVNPQSATLYDFNNDNKLDSAVANTGSNSLMILTGNGDNTFQTPVTLAGDAPGPRTIAAADLNKDNRGDLIIGHSNGVDIRLGNGNGTFQAPVRVASGFVANTVASGDFNKDGNPDIAVSTEGSSAAMILLGNGNGTFQQPTSYVTRANAGNFFASDFDFDGNTDLVFAAGHPDALVAANGDTNVSVLYGRGNGTVHSAPAVVLSSLGDFTTGDFNGDGIADVASTAPTTNGAVNLAGFNLSISNGTGTLVPQNPIPVSPGGTPVQLSKITSGDFNGDGRRDIAVTSGNMIHMLVASGNTFSLAASIAGGASMTSLSAADVNGDGRVDLIITDDAEDRVSVALASGAGFQARTLLPVGVDPRSAIAADVNGDGRPDLIVANFGQAGNDAVPGGISVLLNNSGTFGAASNFASGIHPSNVSVGDINLDGRPDLIVTTGGANAATFVAVHLGNGNGTFQTPTMLPVGFGPAQTAVTDFNGDGKLDILVGHCCGTTPMGVLTGNGNGTFQSETTVPNTGNGSTFLSVADVNRDSRPDVLFGANGTNGAFIGTLLNVSTATFTCTYGISQTLFTPSAAAQNLTGTITATSDGCAFVAQYAASWITFTPFTGSGTVGFNIAVQANTGIQRSANITIGAQTITVTQAAPACPYTLVPTTLSPPPAGGSYSIALTSSPGCPWSITNVPAWITITQPVALGSSGSGTINLTVANNAGVARIANLTIAGQTFPVTQAGTGPAGGLRFTAIEPCRVVETRQEYNFEGRTGTFGPPFFAVNETRTMALPTSNVCRNIPATAKAYVLNVTVVPRGPLDFVTVYPTGETRPDFWTVRSPDGLIVANSAIVAAGTNGGISVFASNATDLIIDISGYFTDSPVVSNLVYYPLTPCRVIESRIDYRSPPGPFGPPTMSARETRTFRFPSNGACPVPAGAAAYAATITVIPPASLAFLTAWPEGGAQPNVSSMNSPAGRVLANSVIVPASPDGSINLFTFDRSDVIVDITGYFGPDDGATGLFFFPVRQCRVSQTNGTGFTGIFNGPIFENETARTIPIPSSACAGIPAGSKAYSLNATVIPGGSPMPFLTVYPSGQGRPNASVINAFEGQTVSSGFLVTAGAAGAVDVFAYRRTHVAIEISGYFNR